MDPDNIKPNDLSGLSGDNAIQKNEVKQLLCGINEYSFEHFIADMWREAGWNAEVTQKSADGGIDVIAKKESPFGFKRKQYIQVKRHHRDNPVGSPDVDQFASKRRKRTPDNKPPDDLILVTSSSLTQAAEKSAREGNVKVVTGKQLARIIVEFGLHSQLSEYTQEDIDDTQNTGNKLTSAEYTNEQRSRINKYNKNLSNYTRKSGVTYELPFDAELVVDATTDGELLYRLVHGPYHPQLTDSKIDTHIIPDPSEEQVNLLTSIAEETGLDTHPDLLSGYAVYRNIRTYNPEKINTQDTVLIGGLILEHLFDKSADDIEIKVKDLANTSPVAGGE